MRILVVDDEKSLIRLITHNLEKEGYCTLFAYDGFTALEMIKETEPDLVILDLMLPGIGGLDICKKVRQLGIDTPIIMLTARDEEIDKVLGLEIGADDYITKPFGIRELMARIKAVLRRHHHEEKNNQRIDTILEIGPFCLNLDSYIACFYNQQIELTVKEFELLVLFLKNKNRVLKRDFILDTLWGYEVVTESRIVDVYVSKLREKIEPDSKHPCYIKTVRGLGYKFEVPSL